MSDGQSNPAPSGQGHRLLQSDRKTDILHYTNNYS